jgi:hypothetical protein
VAHFHFLDETGLQLDYTWCYACATRRLIRRLAGTPKAGRSLTLIGAFSVRELQRVQVLNEALMHCSLALYSSYILEPRLCRGEVLDNLRLHCPDRTAKIVSHAWGLDHIFAPLFCACRTGAEQAQMVAVGASPQLTRVGISPLNNPALDYACRRSTLVLRLRISRTPFVNLL